MMQGTAVTCDGRGWPPHMMPAGGLASPLRPDLGIRWQWRPRALVKVRQPASLYSRMPALISCQ
jgi:hypothetical protein